MGSMMERTLRTKLFIALGVAVALVYFCSRLVGLLSLPIFADESIYIRWAQLIIADPAQYLFFALNDGKTPLFVWQLVPLLQTGLDPLWVSRLLSVIAGAIQMLLIYLIGKKMGLHNTAVMAGLAIVIFTPYWFFHHRMALMDAWLVVWLSATMYGVLWLTSSIVPISSTPVTFSRKIYSQPSYVIALALTALSFAGAVLTKIPAVLAIPALVLTPWLLPGIKRREAIIGSVKTAVVLMCGVALSGLLMFHPSGPQLFSRGSDFLLPIDEVLFAGRWRETLPSFSTYLSYFSTYLGLGVLLLGFVSVFHRSWRTQAVVLYLQWFTFLAPIWLLGRVVFPRYLFPGVLFLTLLAMCGVQVLDLFWRSSRTSSFQRLLVVSVGTIVVALSAIVSVPFLTSAWTNSDQIPFVSPDEEQYLSRWSSGHGVLELYKLMQDWSAQNPGPQELLVATEGRFGTMPDALLLYNFQNPIDRVRIEGTGLTGLHRIPEEIEALVSPDATKWLVVNSDRLDQPLPPDWLVAEYCRPVGTTCLQVWELKNDVY